MTPDGHFLLRTLYHSLGRARSVRLLPCHWLWTTSVSPVILRGRILFFFVSRVAVSEGVASEKHHTRTRNFKIIRGRIGSKLKQYASFTLVQVRLSML